MLLFTGTDVLPHANDQFPLTYYQWNKGLITIKASGAWKAGISQVIKINSYHMPISTAQLGKIYKNALLSEIPGKQYGGIYIYNCLLNLVTEGQRKQEENTGEEK